LIADPTAKREEKDMGTGANTLESPAIQKRGSVPLAGRTAVVMGAPPKLGGALADALATRGANVVLGESGARRPRGRRAVTLQAVRKTIDQRLETAHARLGHIDVLVTAATFPPDGDHIPDGPRSLFESQVPLHLVDTWCAAHSAARLMADDRRGGEILIVCRCGDDDTSPHAANQASPVPEATLARDLARCFRPNDIRVNVLALGPDAPSEALAESLAFLVSEAADPVSGATLVVSGGGTATRRRG
jgi:NAD(P)-dependent dehydrogenase (short-subunit alcohol dehydrogenase family)